MEVTYKVHREDPENGGESSYSTYQVDLSEEATVLGRTPEDPGRTG